MATYKYYTQQFIKDGVNFEEIFTEKQKESGIKNGLAYRLPDVVEFIRVQSNNFTTQEQFLIDLDVSVKRLVEQYVKIKEKPKEEVAKNMQPKTAYAVGTSMTPVKRTEPAESDVEVIEPAPVPEPAQETKVDAETIKLVLEYLRDKHKDNPDDETVALVIEYLEGKLAEVEKYKQGGEVVGEEPYYVVGKKRGQLVDISEHPMTKADCYKFIKEQGVENYYTDVAVIPYHGKKPMFKYAEGGTVGQGMLETNLSMLEEYAEKIPPLVDDDKNLPAWIVSKMSKAEQAVAAVKHALEAKHPTKFEEGGAVDTDGKYVSMQCRHIGLYAKSLLAAVKDGVKTDDWMDSILSVSASDIDSVYHYLDFAAHGEKFEEGGVIAKETMAKGGKVDKKEDDGLWIQHAIKHKGALRRKAKELGIIKGESKLTLADLEQLEKKLTGAWTKKINLARNLMKLPHGHHKTKKAHG